MNQKNKKNGRHSRHKAQWNMPKSDKIDTPPKDRSDTKQ